MMVVKKWIIIALALFLWVGIADAAPAASRKAKATKRRPQAAKIKSDQEPYKAYIVMEAATGKVLEGENIHQKRPPASITKLMVACIVMEKLAKGKVKLTDMVPASKEAARIGGSQVYLKEGETFSLEDMMKAMMVASGNDAAYAIAQFIAGSKEEFIAMMNEKAKALNLADTEFHSVHGLPPSKDEKEDLTSCSDLATLARELLKYPKLLEWTAIKSDSFRDGKFTLTNTNKLLVKFPGTDGLKTGYYREAGFCIAATAKRGDLRFIVVVMGSPTGKIRDNIAAEKLKKAFAQYKMLNVVKKGELVDKDIMLPDGKYRKMKGVADRDFLYPVPVDKKANVKKEIVLPDKVKGEIREGQKLGELLIKLDNDTIGKVDIVSPVFVPKANLFTRLIRTLGLNI
ncbi:MAG TPA: D-alanyl-D-alanine carboxypeptidase family protein [Syntrophorhabdaceae bacterium]|nr:D-alanyl-D-alanine carboxypeptidase family protein [Syntrophorhabdaceae bacterium]HNT68033.1 D-alanyl-D-alanine carboxypeptidase family protein [Syntrophorhabdaceae bacterium]